MKDSTVTTDMIHDEDEMRHAFHHLLKDGLNGNETLMVYRNARNKYSEAFRESSLKDGIRGIESFRTTEDGIVASYRAAICTRDIEREASAMYLTINPRDVPQALKATHEHYYKWIEHKAGASKEKVKKGDRQDFAATLDTVLKMSMLKSRSRMRFNMIDVDDTDPTTWLAQTRQAIGDEAIEMIIQTKNGYHVVYRPKDMDKIAHMRLEGVLSSDPGKGQDAHVSKGKGTMISCALPGGYQADHATTIFYCSCERGHGEPYKQDDTKNLS